MYRYTLTVPTIDNDGRPLTEVHENVRLSLERRFPGFTAHDGTGYWGGEHAGHEPVTVYVIDAGADDLDHLRAIARYVKYVGQQDAVYLTRQTIDTWLV